MTTTDEQVLDEMRLDKYSYGLNQQCGLILRDGEAFEIYMNPKLYIEQNLEGLDPTELQKLVIHEIQNELHDLLDIYLRGSIATAPPFRVTLGQQVHDNLENLRWYVARLGLLAYGLNTDDLKNALSRALRKKVLTAKDLAKLISACYVFFDSLIGEAPDRPSKKLPVGPCRPYLEDNYKSDFLKPVAQLKEYAQKHLSDYLVGFYVHGSLSTLDYCGYSDLDTLMIIRNSTMRDPEKLYSFQKSAFSSTRFLHMVDPLQHHGHFVLTEADLNYFPETYFPPVLFEHSTVLVGEANRLAVRPRECSVEKCKAVWGICYSFRRSYLGEHFPRDCYSLKSYLSMFMLLPALYLQWKGAPCYKKFSFAEARSDFSIEDWQVMEDISGIREKWGAEIGASKTYRKLLQMSWNPLLVSKLNRMLRGRIPDWLDTFVSEGTYERATILAERISSRLVEEKLVRP